MPGGGAEGFAGDWGVLVFGGSVCEVDARSQIGGSALLSGEPQHGGQEQTHAEDDPSQQA